jgi:hypothetical protein
MRGYYDDCKSGCLPLPAKEEHGSKWDGLADNRRCAFGDVDDPPDIDVDEQRDVDRSNGRPHAATGAFEAYLCQRTASQSLCAWCRPERCGGRCALGRPSLAPVGFTANP